MRSERRNMAVRADGDRVVVVMERTPMGFRFVERSVESVLARDEAELLAEAILLHVHRGVTS